MLAAVVPDGDNRALLVMLFLPERCRAFRAPC